MLNYRNANSFFGVLVAVLLLLDLLYSLTPLIYTGVVFLYLVVVTFGSFVLSAQFFVPVKFKGNVSSGAIAITFDDGPVPGYTEKILKILDSHKVTAAFFCIGHRINDHSALVKQIHNAGHLIGNHSYWHKYTFDLQRTETIELELNHTNTAIQKAIGLWPNFFRPPFGVTNPMVARAIKRGGYKTIGWSLRSFDTVSQNRKVLLKRLTLSVKAGDIILFHDYCSLTLEVLPEFLDFVSDRGLKILRVDELLDEKAYS